MGYRFDGFFVRTEEPAFAQELALSAKRQWPFIICRRISDPFPGLGIRMSSFTKGEIEEGVEQHYALKDELLSWSKQFPTVTFLYLSADCFGGTCLYEGYICRNGTVLFEEDGTETGSLPLLRLLEHFGVKAASGYFKPFERGFFGPEKYFYPFEPEEDLEAYLSQNWFRE